MKTLNELRNEIDEVNRALIELLAKRLNLTLEIARAKKALELPVYDAQRERLQDKRLSVLAMEKKLDPRVVQNLFHLWVNYTRDEMNRHLRKSKKVV